MSCDTILFFNILQHEIDGKGVCKSEFQCKALKGETWFSNLEATWKTIN